MNHTVKVNYLAEVGLLKRGESDDSRFNLSTGGQYEE